MRESPKREKVVPVSGTAAVSPRSWKVAKTSTPPTVPTRTDAPSALMGNWVEEDISLVMMAACVMSVPKMTKFTKLELSGSVHACPAPEKKLTGSTKVQKSELVIRLTVRGDPS